MRGFRKGITLVGRTYRSAIKVMGGVGGTRGNMVLAQEEIWWGGPLHFSVTPVQSWTVDSRQSTLDFGLSTWTWTSTGLSLDNILKS